MLTNESEQHKLVKIFRNLGKIKLYGRLLHEQMPNHVSWRYYDQKTSKMKT